MRKFWTKQEDDILYDNYYDLPTEELQQLLPCRTWNAIKLRARKLDLYRSLSLARKSNMKNLLSGSVTSFYWVGFILADGHIENNNRLTVTISAKDINHLSKLATFLNTSIREGVTKLGDNTYRSATIACKDIDNIPFICSVFDIDNNKTKNPPDFSSYVFTNEQVLSLIIGFIDGDGSITKLHNRSDVNLRIKCHSSWLDNLLFIERTVYDYCSIPYKNPPLSKLNTQGYASLCISNNDIIRELRDFCIRHHLPILERKWSKIT